MFVRPYVHVHTCVRLSVRPQKVSSISMKFGSMTRSNVKVMSLSELEIWPFSKAISSAIYSGSWQLTTDS